METPTSVEQLLLFLTEPDFPIRSLNNYDLSAESREEMAELLQITSLSPDIWDHETGLIALWRAFLALIPASVIDNPNQRCKEAVTRRLTHLLGIEPKSEHVDAVVVIVKRLQRYKLTGRQATSLDIQKNTHFSILRSQLDRCATCGYKFRKGDVEPDPSSTSSRDRPRTSKRVGSFDRSPEPLRRRAVLDHILPVYLAGDHHSNWQILCDTCNSGKGDMIYGFEGRAWFGGARETDLAKVSFQLFYMVVNRDRSCKSCLRSNRECELRVVRKESGGADLYTNLEAKCTECLGRES